MWTLDAQGPVPTHNSRPSKDALRRIRCTETDGLGLRSTSYCVIAAVALATLPSTFTAVLSGGAGTAAPAGLEFAIGADPDELSRKGWVYDRLFLVRPQVHFWRRTKLDSFVRLGRDRWHWFAVAEGELSDELHARGVGRVREVATDRVPRKPSNAEVSIRA